MDELVKLILSLTKAEKRYFKMFSSIQSGEKGYLKLFEAIEKHGNYEEEKIKKMFAGEEFIKRLPAVKNYLYHQILKSLRIMCDAGTVNSQLKGMLEDITILYEKRLFKQCFKILDRAIELAKSNELHLQLIEIKNWEEKILKEILNLEKFEKFISTSYPEEVRLLKVQRNIIEYKNLYNKIFLLNRKLKEARTEEELEQFAAIINHPLLQSVNEALCFDSKHYFYLIHLIFNHAKGDNETSFIKADKKLRHMESFPDIIKERPKMYLAALTDLLICQIHLHRYDNFNTSLNKLREFQVKTLSLEVNKFVSSYTFEMVMYLDTGEFKKGTAILNDILLGLKKYSDKINVIEEVTLLYNIFYLYFGTGEFTKALGIINKILNEYQKELRYDIQSAVRILNLIVHYELGNHSLLEYHAVSTYRFLYRSKRLYKLENIVLDFIRKKMPAIYSHREQIEAFRELREQFVELSDHPFEKKAFEYFDYISWLDSKIEEKPFEEIVKSKFYIKSKVAH